MAQICQRVELGDSDAASPHTLTLAVSASAVRLLLPAHQVLLAQPLLLAQH